MIGDTSHRSMAGGKVCLVGAGPGDAGLITLRGDARLSEADVVLYDNLVNEEILASCRGDCEKIYVGKSAGSHVLPQEEINGLLLAKVREGKTVVRLKGGDPFVFGRGAEEVLELKKHGVEVEVVPGVTAAVAVPAYAGIPLTHRALTSSVAFVTGQEFPDKERSGIAWERISTGVGTLVFYMGVKNLPQITRRLIENGRDQDTPAALIRMGTYPCQRTLTGTLGTIAEGAAEGEFSPPAIFIVGEVVSLRGSLRWYDNRPLFGKRILVTRSRGQSSVLKARLLELGAEVVEFPTIEIKGVEGSPDIERAIEGIDGYDWIVFTSANGVDAFFALLFEGGRDARVLGRARVAVIGPGTASTLQGFGIQADYMPEVFLSERIASDFRARLGSMEGARVLMPVSNMARDVISRELESMGARVDVVTVYETLRPAYTAERIDAVFTPPPDLVTFTSSSTAANLADILADCGREDVIRGVRGASIGPVTSRAARERGITLAVEAEEHTIPGLVEAILRRVGDGA
jgi:uroporphyrinogen III methyltransferase/synthase